MKITKEVFSSAFILTGGTVGAGILALPYVFSKSGYLIGLFWLLFLGAIILFINLSFGEITLRNKKIHHIVGYAETYLGKNGKRVALFATFFGIYSALLAYLIGEGQSLSQLIFGNPYYSLYFGIAFWLAMTLLLRDGLRGLKTLEFFGVTIVISIIVIISLQFFPQVELSNLSYSNLGGFWVPFGVVLFSLLGFSAIPEIRMSGGGKKLKTAIIIGTLIPILLYLLFTFALVGVFGENIQQVSTISGSPITIILGIFTMFTSYFILSFALGDIILYDLKKKSLSFIFVSLIPLLLYILISIFDFANFVQVIEVGGIVSGGLTGILILLINLKAKKKGNRKPEYSIPINWFIIGVLSLIFVLGMFFELF